MKNEKYRYLAIAYWYVMMIISKIKKGIHLKGEKICQRVKERKSYLWLWYLQWS